MKKKFKKVFSVVLATATLIGNINFQYVKSVQASESKAQMDVVQSEDLAGAGDNFDVSNYFTIYYHEDMDAEASDKTSQVEYGVTTKTLTASELGYSREGYLLKGWYVRKQADGKWAYTTDGGKSVIWATECPEGGELCLYKEGTTVAKTVAAGKAVDFYGVWVVNYFTIQYHKDMDSSASKTTTNVLYGKDTKTLTAAELGFENGNKALAGWYLYRESDNKWAYTTDGGESVIWAAECPEGGELCLYKAGTSVARTVPAGTVVHFYGVWIENYFTIKYHEDINSDSSAQTTSVFYGEPTRFLTADDLGYKHENEILYGWYGQRESDGKWAYTTDDGASVVWASECPEGGELYVYAPNDTVAKTVVPGNTVHFYGKWISNVIDVSEYGVSGADDVDDTESLRKILLLGKDNKSHITIKIPQGNYYLSKQLMIYSNTTLILDDNAIMERLDDDQEMIVGMYDSGELKGGYDQVSNITVIGGKWYGNVQDTTNLSDLMRFNHCNNITIKNMTFKGYCGKHMVTFAGANEILVENVTFEDAYLYTGEDVGDYYSHNEDGSIDYELSYRTMEALHIDVITEDGVSEGGAFPLDGTICNNITVKNCKFNNLISGVGNHALLDVAGSGFTITGNEFTNLKAVGIDAYNYDNVYIADNTATEVSSLVVMGNCSGDIVNNTVSISEDKFIDNRVGIQVFSCRYANVDKNTITNSQNSGARITDTNNLIFTNNNIKDSKENGIFLSNVNGGKIELNEISDSALHGIQLSGSNIDILNNTLTNSINYGIVLTSNSSAIMDNNIISNTGKDGIFVNACSSTSISGNTFSFITENAIDTYQADISNISGNIIKDSQIDGIHISSSKIENINDNQISDAVNNGINIVTKSEVSNISSNTIENAKIYGIVADDSKIIAQKNIINKSVNHGIMIKNNASATVSENQVNNAGSNGIHINSGYADIENNTVTSPAAIGIVIYNCKADSTTINKVVNNKISGTGDAGITVSSSSYAEVNGNTIDDPTTIGIQTNTSDNLSIIKNVINRSVGNGIILTSTTDSMVNTNQINNAGTNGIQLSGSTKDIVNGNTVTASTKYGIVLTSKSNAAIDNNIINGAGKDGIFVNTGSTSSIAKNKFTLVKEHAIDIYSAEVENISENIIDTPEIDGIHISASKVNNINDNKISGAYIGINAVSASVVDNASANTINESTLYGIQSDNSTLTAQKNTIDTTVNHGIMIKNKSNAVLKENLINNAGSNGINVNASLADIKGNTITLPVGIGILVYNSKYSGNEINKITDNTVTDSGDVGIRVHSSSNADIIGNRISGAKAIGIQAHTSSNVNIDNNVISNSTTQGIQAYNSETVNVTGNLVSNSGNNGITINGSTDVIVTGNDAILSGKKDINAGTSSTGYAKDNFVGTGGAGTYSSTEFPVSNTLISIRVADVCDIDAVDCTGSEICPKVVVSYNGAELKEGEDYQVKYSDNVKPGTATVTIEGIGQYGSKVTKTFIINEKTILTGWQKVDGKWYYFDKTGIAKTGWQSIGGKWYYFDKSGIMKTGWQSIGGKWYYLDKSGVMQTGWQSIGSKWYYFNKSGVMYTGWRSIGGKWYYFNKSGVMQTGWQSIGGKWYYLDKSGVMQTGWQSIGGKWYGFNKSGVMYTGWQSIGGKLYYFNKSGVMQTGWQDIGNDRYYFNSSGVMQTSKWISGIYYLKSDGKMAKDEWVCDGKYYVNSNGEWVKGA